MMHARVTHYVVRTEHVADAVRLFRQSAVTANKAEKGFTQSLLLVDQATGKATSITLWETEADMKASLAGHQQRTESTGGQDIMREAPRTELYEVSVNERP